jgi:hypothetical protein
MILRLDTEISFTTVRLSFEAWPHEVGNLLLESPGDPHVFFRLDKVQHSHTIPTEHVLWSA